MIERIITLTIFLCLVFLLRGVFYRRICKCLCYAMWLVAALYLLMPVQSFPNSFQVMNIIYQIADTENGFQIGSRQKGTRAYFKDTPSDAPEDAISLESGDVMTGRDESDLLEAGKQSALRAESDEEKNVHSTMIIPAYLSGWESRIKGIWILGSIICGIVFLVGNFHFGKRLRKDRQRLEMDWNHMEKSGYKQIPVYRTKEVNTPCLFGVLHPAVYFPEKGIEFGNTGKEMEAYHYVLAHEYMHYMHKDHLWALLRCLCVILYWYHPLVWAAAFLSKRDSEFACDESVIRHYDKRERKAYGETLILIGTQEKSATQLLTCATGMTGGRQELKKRITLIANPRKLRLGTAVLVCLLLFGVTGCTIGGSRQNSGKTRNENNDYIDSTKKNEADTAQTENQNETKKNEANKNENPEKEDGSQLLTDPVTDQVCILVYPDEPGIDWGYYVVGEDKQTRLQELINNLDITKIYYEMENLGNDPKAVYHGHYEGMKENIKSLGCSVTYQGTEWELYSNGYLLSRPPGEGESDLWGAQSEELSTMVWQIASEKFGYEEFSPEEIKNIQSATLTYIGMRRQQNGEQHTQTIEEREILDILEEQLSHAEEIQGASACPFYEAVLTLELESGKLIKMSLATDSCSMFRVNGIYYDYMPEGALNINPDDIGYNGVLYEYFDEIPIPK